MPSATPGRYQSRLFNFFHQQSRRWGEQFDRTRRHLQVAASWSLEALLYPVYLLIQKATNSAGRQLHTGEQQRRLHLQGNEAGSQLETPPSADSPIERILEVVVTLQVEDKRISRQADKGKRIFPSPHPFILHSGTPPLPHSSTPVIVQGIASLLVNRNLVLVTAENEILDILTPQQQEKLRNRIIDEVAKYWRSWRLTQVEDDTKLLPEIDRLLNKLTSGRGNKLPALPQDSKTENEIEYKYLPFPFQGLALLDAAVAQIESHTVVPISRASGQLLQVVQTQLNIFLYGKQQQLTTQQEALAADRNQILNIQALIWGAINYFFGERNTKKLEQTTPTNIGSNRKSQAARILQRSPSSTLPKSSHLQSENIADSWLTMNDLFGEVQQVIEVVNEQELLVTSSPTKSAIPASSSARTSRQINSKFKLQNLPNGYATPWRSLRFALTKFKFWHLSSSPHSPTSKPESESEGKTLHPQHRKSTQVEAKPDWIETQAQTIGYEKHPLEQMLEWLDRIMLWLEEIFVNIVQFLWALLREK
ncbi:hypothetical protein [Mastigocladopsis repens]|uniref:hypothetical protein n=1 Tax=Mastigocladopsis repens TaxID=221287 RepID=UPI0002E205F9|nr:hypothetical protein [Mastigocladopsis repens]